MKASDRPCEQYEESVCLLVAGALPESEKPAIEQHLAVCFACRNYHAELVSMATPLMNWEKDFAHVEPSPAAVRRWEQAIENADKPARVLSTTASRQNWRDWLRDLIWPHRRAWAGMVALWLVLGGINFGLVNSQPRTVAHRNASSLPMMQALEEQRRLLAELILTGNDQPTEPPRRDVPRPRSEILTRWKVS